MRLNAKPGSLPNDADNLLSDCASILAGGLEKTFALQDKGLNYPLTWAARLVVRAMPRYVNNDLSVFDEIERIFTPDLPKKRHPQ